LAYKQRSTKASGQPVFVFFCCENVTSNALKKNNNSCYKFPFPLFCTPQEREKGLKTPPRSKKDNTTPQKKLREKREREEGKQEPPFIVLVCAVCSPLLNNNLLRVFFYCGLLLSPLPQTTFTVSERSQERGTGNSQNSLYWANKKTKKRKELERSKERNEPTHSPSFCPPLPTLRLPLLPPIRSRGVVSSKKENTTKEKERKKEKKEGKEKDTL